MLKQAIGGELFKKLVQWKTWALSILRWNLLSPLSFKQTRLLVQHSHWRHLSPFTLVSFLESCCWLSKIDHMPTSTLFVQVWLQTWLQTTAVARRLSIVVCTTLQHFTVSTKGNVVSPCVFHQTSYKLHIFYSKMIRQIILDLEFLQISHVIQL